MLLEFDFSDPWWPIAVKNAKQIYAAEGKTSFDFYDLRELFSSARHKQTLHFFAHTTGKTS